MPAGNDVDVKALQSKIEELEKQNQEKDGIIKELNERLGKVAKLYNLITDMYIQGK